MQTQLNPFKIIKEATKAVPSVKYAVGISGIAAIISIVYGSLKLDNRIAVWGILIMLILMTLLLLFSKLTTIANNYFLLPALVFLWTVIAIFIFTSGCIITSIFFRAPVDLRYWIEKENVVQNPNSSLNTDAVSKHIAVNLIEFQGESIDYLLDRNVANGVWKQWLGDQPLILSSFTSIVDTLKSFKRRFSIFPVFDNTEVHVLKKDEVTLGNLPPLKSYLAGTNPSMSLGSGFYVDTPEARRLGLITRLGAKTDSVPITSDKLSRFNPANHEVSFKDCEGWLSKPFFKLYQSVARNYVPSDFMSMQLGDFDECGSSDDGPKCGNIFLASQPHYIVYFSTPILKMGAYCVKNNGNEEAVIENIDFRIYHSDSLRSFQNNDRITPMIKREKVLIRLQPKQTLIIPSYIGFIPYDEEGGTLRKGYVYGSNYQLDSMRINDTRFMPVKVKESEAGIIKTDGFEYGPMGSCPYVYSRDKNEYKFIGHLIYKNNSAAKIGWYSIKMTNLKNEIEVREIDPEESFIDQVFIKFIPQHGKEIIYYAEDNLLKTKDANFLHLKKGDKKVIKFILPTHLTEVAGTYYLYSYGYYIPYKHKM